MKNLFLVCLFALLSIPAIGKVQFELPKDIELEGGFEFDRGKSALQPVEAFIQEGQVSVTFFVDLADATVTITSVDNVMQTRLVSFTELRTETFDVSNLKKGEYTLSITTPRGTNLHGSFSVE